MVGRPVVAVALLLAVVLSGCSGGTKDDANKSNSKTTSGTPGNVTLPGNNSTSVLPPTAPVLDATVSALNGSIPWIVNITINGTDANDDALSWNVTLNGTEVANGTTVPGNASINVTVAGNHTLDVTLSDGTNSATQTFALEALAGGPVMESLTQDDPDADAESDFTEILDLTATLDGKAFTVVAHVGDVPTGMGGSNLAFSPYGFRLTINDGVYRCYNYVGVDTFSDPDGAYIGGCTWSEADDVVTMSITLDLLEGADITAPYEFSFVSYEGGVAFEVNPDDAVPDSGTLVIG